MRQICRAGFATSRSAFRLKMRHRFGALAAALLGLCVSNSAQAYQGGVSFWVPGFFGCLAATPQQPGFSYANIYYHTSVSAGGNVAFARQVTAGRLTTNFNGNVNANLDASAALYMGIPQYVFATPVLGGQAAIAAAVPYGRSRASVDATLTGSLGPLGFPFSGRTEDARSGWGDIAPMFTLRWNQGVHNFMTYLTGNLTTGRYDPSRLANLGIGHNAIDAGGAYTYFDPQKGHEFSATLGFTYNFENVHTDYQHGIDMHWYWGASQFLSKQLQVGLVGYLYNQLSCDSGSGDRVGCFKSRVAGIGPQIGYNIPITNHSPGYIHLKGDNELAAENG